MNVNDLPPYVREFLAGFFGPGNELRLETLGSAASEFLEPWLAALADERHPALLPRVEKNGDTRWYAIAFSERRARELKQELMAFVGPTYSDFNGRAAELDLNDPIESALSDLEQASVFSFKVIEPEERDTVREVLTHMRNLWDVRPERDAIGIRTTSRLLRDFEMALEVANETSAQKSLATLRREGRLSSQNYLFLKVRLLSTFHHWNEILEMPELGAVLDLHRRPQLVNQALIKAVYATELEPFEAADEPGKALSHFRETVLVEYPQLFRSRGALVAPAVMKSFMMLAGATVPPRPETRDEILEEYPTDASDRAYLEQLAELVEDKKCYESEDTLELAQQAYDQNDFDRTFDHLRDAANNSKERLELMLRCAYEINTLEAVRYTLNTFAEAPDVTTEKVLSTRYAKDLWEKLNELADAPRKSGADTSRLADDIPDSWASWLRRLNDEGSWPSAWEVAEKGTLEWSHDPLRTSPETVQKIADLLMSSRDREANQILRNAVPLLLRYFLPEGEAERRYAEVYQSLLYVLTIDGPMSKDDLTAIHDLSVALLESGVTEDEYVEMVEMLHTAWAENEAPSSADWALDILDVVVAHPCRNEKAREELFSRILGAFQGFSRRVRAEQWELLELICRDFGFPEALEGVRPQEEPTDEDRESTVAERLRGKSIAIYTLTESVSRRVKDFLGQKYDDVSVSVSNAYGGTARLRRMARNADIFLVATRSAKHAATEFISAERPSNKVTLYPTGKGSSSMLRELFEYLER